jgi:hypothetical protein
VEELEYIVGSVVVTVLSGVTYAGMLGVEYVAGVLGVEYAASMLGVEYAAGLAGITARKAATMLVPPDSCVPWKVDFMVQLPVFELYSSPAQP